MGKPAEAIYVGRMTWARLRMDLQAKYLLRDIVVDGSRLIEFDDIPVFQIDAKEHFNVG